MKQMLMFLLVCTLCLMTAALAQDESSMPKPLDDAMLAWLVGEWSGTGESAMGTAKEWQKNTMSLDNQFVEMEFSSQFIKLNPEFVKGMAATMKMPEKEVEQMMKTTIYKGMGLMTMDAKTGEYIGYWFDSMRGMYRGTGKLEGNKILMRWEGNGGSSDRTVEKSEKGELVQSYKQKDPTGNVTEGKSVFTKK